MRNREGFQLPPRVPSDPTERRRAVELLGCCTQRKRLRPSTVTELQSLVGKLPPNRLLAQQWKGAIQRDLGRANRKRSPTAFEHRHQLMETLTLSECNGSVSRCFILLEAVRKRYQANEAPNPKCLEELERLLGSFPKTSVEAHRFIRSLARMQRDRRKMEKKPPRVPVESVSDLYQASMLLGSYAVRGSVGSQTEKLKTLIGAIPRNKNVAHSWQKLIKAAIRKRKRREQKEQRRQEIEQKRFERQLRKLRKKSLANAGAQALCPGSQLERTPVLQQGFSWNQPRMFYEQSHQRKTFSIVTKVCGFFARFCAREC
ncbi:hypothetical protein FGB62_111g04 [Gracilaria domingensis]|nr:hypothetical protein FGB62_111g04 [Gracilaria domingensis]